MTASSQGGSKVTRWRWAVHVALLSLYILPNIVLAGRIRHHPALTNSTRGLIIVNAWEILVFGIIFAVACLVSRVSREQLLLKWNPNLWVLPLGVAYSIALRIGVALVIGLLFLILGVLGILNPESLKHVADDSQSGVEKLVAIHALKTNAAYLWLALTFESFIVAALREELWRAAMLAGTRALWPRTFGDVPGGIAAVAIIAVVFGAAHLYMGIIAMAGATLIGFMLGVTLVVHRSIWPAVLAHGLFNATSFAVMASALEHTR